MKNKIEDEIENVKDILYYQKIGYTTAEISEALDTPIEIVASILCSSSNNNSNKDKHKKNRKTRVNITDKICQEINDLYLKGTNKKTIAKKYDVCIQTVTRCLSEEYRKKHRVKLGGTESESEVINIYNFFINDFIIRLEEENVYVEDTKNNWNISMSKQQTKSLHNALDKFYEVMEKI